MPSATDRRPPSLHLPAASSQPPPASARWSAWTASPDSWSASRLMPLLSAGGGARAAGADDEQSPSPQASSLSGLIYGPM